MDVRNISVKELIPYERNTKKHDKTQINNVAESIKSSSSLSVFLFRLASPEAKPPFLPRSLASSLLETGRKLSFPAIQPHLQTEK